MEILSFTEIAKVIALKIEIEFSTYKIYVIFNAINNMVVQSYFNSLRQVLKKYNSPHWKLNDSNN